MEQQRLQPIIDRRRVGFTVDPRTGIREPKIVGYIIDHGQQLAARRLAAKVNANAERNAMFNTMAAVEVDSRQVRRAAVRAKAKVAARQAREKTHRAARKARKRA